MGINYSEFLDMEFPRRKEIVYILYCRQKDDQQEIPFYVGESSRGIGRFCDYLSAQFAAPTDFKVGEAIRHLNDLGFTVHVRYKESRDRRNEEKEIIRSLGGSYRLLNDLKGFNYKKSDPNNERKSVHHFVDELVQQTGRNQAQADLKSIQTTFENKSTVNRDLPIPKVVLSICERLGKGGDPIYRRDIISKARELGLNASSVLPADYCDNTATGKWSKHTFLHSLGRGKYVLITSV